MPGADVLAIADASRVRTWEVANAVKVPVAHAADVHADKARVGYDCMNTAVISVASCPMDTSTPSCQARPSRNGGAAPAEVAPAHVPENVVVQRVAASAAAACALVVYDGPERRKPRGAAAVTSAPLTRRSSVRESLGGGRRGPIPRSREIPAAPSADSSPTTASSLTCITSAKTTPAKHPTGPVGAV